MELFRDAGKEWGGGGGSSCLKKKAATKRQIVALPWIKRLRFHKIARSSAQHGFAPRLPRSTDLCHDLHKQGK